MIGTSKLAGRAAARFGRKPFLQLSMISAAAAAGSYTRFTLSPLQEAAGASLHLSDTQVAVLQGPVLAIPMLLASIPFGWLIDSFARVRLLLLVAVLDLVGTLLTAASGSFEALLLSRCLIGAAAFQSGIVSISMIADLFPPGERARANMVSSIAQIAGAAAAFSLGGLLLAGTRDSNWRLAMAELSLPLFAVIPLILAMPEPTRSEPGRQRQDFYRAGLALWKFRATVLPLLLGLSVFGIADGAALIWAAPALSRQFHLSPDWIGLIVGGALFGGGICGPVLGGLVGDACQRRGGPRLTVVALSGLSLVAALPGAFAIMPDAFLASIALIGLVAIGNAIAVIILTLSTLVVPESLRGLCASILSASSALFGLGLAPLTVSKLSSALGGPSMIGASLAIVGAAAAIVGAALFAATSQLYDRPLFVSAIRSQPPEAVR